MEGGVDGSVVEGLWWDGAAGPVRWDGRGRAGAVGRARQGGGGGTGAAGRGRWDLDGGTGAVGPAPPLAAPWWSLVAQRPGRTDTSLISASRGRSMAVRMAVATDSGSIQRDGSYSLPSCRWVLSCIGVAVRPG